MANEIPDYPAKGEGRPSPASLSRAPSWGLLGFLLGVGFMSLSPFDGGPDLGFVSPVERAQPAVPPKEEPVQPEEPKPEAEPVSLAPRPLSEIEAVFEAYGQYAVWDRDVTQVAMWNAQTGRFSDAYEVMRRGDVLWFRSIPLLTRPLLALVDHPESPLVFTETEELRREREAARRQLVPAIPEPSPMPDRRPKVEMPRP